MPRLLGLILVIVSAVWMTACTSDQDISQTTDPNKVSSIPWNRPESWEGQGAMGGMMPGTH